MATNGESARKWLEENQHNIPAERVQHIRDNIATKLQRLDDPDSDHNGLLEALDVMDSFLLQQQQPDTEGNSENSVTEPPPLDYSPLVDHHSEAAPQLTPEEKRQRFQSLLQKAKQ